MSSLPFVSILIPCYNGACFVERCFNSILAQNYAPLEVVIVNDGSSDNSEEAILSWRERLATYGIKLVYIHQENQGSGGATNTGLKAVTGKYLLLLDIDDALLPGAIISKSAYLESHSELDAVRSNGYFERKSGRSLFAYESREKSEEHVFECLLTGDAYNWAASYMVRTSALFDFYPNRNIYVTRGGQNLQILMPVVYKKRCGYIDEPQSLYYIQENSLTNTTNTASFFDFQVRNYAAFRDIRIHLLEAIVHDENEYARYHKLVDSAYYRSLIQLAINTKRDRALLREYFANLRALTSFSLNDRIMYCTAFHPRLVLPLRILRKIKTLLCSKN